MPGEQAWVTRRPGVGSVSQAPEPDFPWLLSQPLGVVCGQSPGDEWPYYLTCRNCSPSLYKPHLLFTFRQTLYNWLHPAVTGHFCPSNP